MYKCGIKSLYNGGNVRFDRRDVGYRYATWLNNRHVYATWLSGIELKYWINIFKCERKLVKILRRMYLETFSPHQVIWAPESKIYSLLKEARRKDSRDGRDEHIE